MDRDEARRLGRKLLGDRVSDLAEKTGVSKLVRAVERATGWRCGCERRRQMLNKIGRKRSRFR